jgi:FkbM family methyltransferase
VCLDREYERHGTAIRDGWSVVDIGAGLGEFAISVAREHPGCRVYAFEPCDEALTLLRENVDLNEVRNVTPLPYAVAARGGVSVLRVPVRRRATASTARTPGGGASRSVPVPCVTLREAFRDLGIRRCDFLKLDCEGAEYEIMLGADADTTDRIAHIGMEYHEGVAGRSVGDLVGFLRSRGFSVRTVPNPAHPRAMGLLYATS